MAENFPAVFRQFMALDRRRKSEGLSVAELARWHDLKRALNRRFQPDSDPDQQDKRESVRVPLRLTVAFGSTGQIRESLMTNLSRGGLFVATDTPLPIGTPFQLRIQVESKQIEVEGVVATHHTGANLRSEERGMGIRFVSMDEGTQKEIDDLYDGALVRAVEPAKKETGTPKPS